MALGYLVGRIVVARVLLPAYYRGELTTAYALLETRFGIAVRRCASGIFMIKRLLADSVRLFATAIPLALITGWSYPVSILVLGAATLVYTYLGGIKAVVWVDALQMALYVAGGLIALALLQGAVDGGWGAILDQAGAAGKLAVLDFSTSPGVAYTFWAGLIGGGFLSMASHGADQLIVQRLLTCRSERDSRRALIGSGFAVLAQFALFLVVGLGLWAFYQGRAFDSSDEIFARFIIDEMPVGVRGLLVAGVVAAAMSSLSSSINSLASASAYDFWSPITGRSDDRAVLAAGKVFTLVWAALLVTGAIVFIPLSQGTAAVEVALAAASMAYGGLLGAFALGVLDGAGAVGAGEDEEGGAGLASGPGGGGGGQWSSVGARWVGDPDRRDRGDGCGGGRRDRDLGRRARRGGLAVVRPDRSRDHGGGGDGAAASGVREGRGHSARGRSRGSARESAAREDAPSAEDLRDLAAGTCLDRCRRGRHGLARGRRRCCRPHSGRRRGDGLG